uniref:Uncharacterized protein n=1 Tax=Oryza rufipogon TaxID=4529 RepID=A0A0E0PUX7_ORYRU
MRATIWCGRFTEAAWETLPEGPFAGETLELPGKPGISPPASPAPGAGDGARQYQVHLFKKTGLDG